jgi:hypothetical protein
LFIAIGDEIAGKKNHASDPCITIITFPSSLSICFGVNFAVVLQYFAWKVGSSLFFFFFLFLLLIFSTIAL